MLQPKKYSDSEQFNGYKLQVKSLYLKKKKFANNSSFKLVKLEENKNVI